MITKQQADRMALELQGQIRFTYLTSALSCIVAAFCLWVGLDAILTNSPLLGGINVVVAFLNGVSFCRAMEWVSAARRAVRDLRALKLPE